MAKGRFPIPGKFLQYKKKEKKTELQPLNPSSNPNPNPIPSSSTSTANTKSKKKTGSRLWMRFDRTGHSELLECDKSAILKRVSIPARDLRILGPVFSHSSNILAREKAMVVNLEFIKAIVTAEEVLLLDPLGKEVIPFVDQLKRQLPLKSPFRFQDSGLHEKEMISTDGQWLPVMEAAEGLQQELPFEFQVLEIALEVVCTYLDSNVADLEYTAYPVLDDLARNVSTKNLESVRSLKSNLTQLLARVQKVHLRSSPTVHANVPIGPPPLLPFGSSCVMPTTQVPAQPDHVALPLQTVTTSTETPVQQPPSNEQSPNIAPSSSAVLYLPATQQLATQQSTTQLVPQNTTTEIVPQSAYVATITLHSDAAPTSVIPHTPSHHMITRSKDGTHRPRVFHSSQYPVMGLFDAHTPLEPRCFTKANKDPRWRLAMADEYNAVISNGTRVLVPSQPHQNVVGCKWVFRIKRKAYGSIDRYKARLVAKGYNQQEGLDYDATFSLVVKPVTVRDEIEHLLDDNEDMEHLYLTRKCIQNQQSEALMAAGASNIIISADPNVAQLSSNIHSNASMVTSIQSDDHDVEDLEMLLEAYFMQLDGTRNKILSVREYVDDTEDYVNIQLDNQRNELIQLQLTLTIASFAIAIETLIAGFFGMNIPCHLYDVHGIFESFVGGVSAACILLFLLMLGYARWKKLLGS